MEFPDTNVGEPKYEKGQGLSFNWNEIAWSVQHIEWCFLMLISKCLKEYTYSVQFLDSSRVVLALNNTMLCWHTLHLLP